MGRTNRLPQGTVTFLFTDIQGSTRLWREHPQAMPAALALHHAILRAAIEAHNGYVFQIIGDAFCAAFPTASDGNGAALQAQQALQAEPWGEIGQIRVRMALHSGAAELRAGDYTSGEYVSGMTLSRTARLLSAGHGGQVLLSQTARDLLSYELPEGVTLLDLGEHRLPDLTHAEHLYQLVAPGLAAEYPPLKSLNNQLTNLPTQPNALVGRGEELQTLVQLLGSAEVRLMTLTGIGGIGKTRLALQAAAELLASFPDGVYFVALDQLTDAGLVPSTIAQALSLEFPGNQSAAEALLAHLRTRHTLLMLDNFEHLLPAASLVSDLLGGCQGLKVLVTSREALHLRGEREFLLDPLPLPDPRYLQPPDQLTQFASVALYIQRAQAVRPDFTVDNASALAVAEICAFLDGLPLAIELAAARVRMFTPQALLARLKAQPGLSMLSGGARDLPARQQTLQSTMEWSYNLLDPAEQTLFRRLGVFAGGFTLEAIEAVCYLSGEGRGDTLELLTSLVEKSLVRVSEDGSEQPRFSLLFVLGQFALGLLEKMDELPTLSAAHAAYYVLLAEQAWPELISNNQARWYDILEQENDNLREVLSWAISTGNNETGLRLTGAIWRFWIQKGHLEEGRSWTKKILLLPGFQNMPPMLRATALDGARGLTDFLGDIKASRAYDEQRLEIYRELDDRRGIAKSMGHLGHMMIQQGEIKSGVQFLEESISLFRETDDIKGLVVSLNMLADYAMQQGDYPLAKRLLDECLIKIDRRAELAYIALTVNNLGLVDLYQGHYDRAMQSLEESYEIYQRLGQQAHMIDALPWIGIASLMQGNLLTARSKFDQALLANQNIDSKPGIASTLDGLAGVAVKRGNPERAAKLFGTAESIREEIELPWSPGDRRLFDPMIGDTRSQMGKDKFASAWSAGRKLLDGGLDQVIAYALEPDEVSGQPSKDENHAGLTNREAEILRLLAQGLADGQIAEKLVISPRTVNAHLTSIYSKLGVNSRAAATRFAIENGLA